jgi:hypothetical protein
MTEDDVNAIIGDADITEGDLATMPARVIAVAVVRVTGHAWRVQIDVRTGITAQERAIALRKAHRGLSTFLTTEDPTIDGWQWDNDHQFWYAGVSRRETTDGRLRPQRG